MKQRHHVELGRTFGSCRVDRVEAGDDRREHHRDRVKHDEDGQRDGEHRRGRALVAALEVLDEDGDERRRQHAADEQLVDDVRRRVREVVGVGERRLAECVGEHCDAQRVR